MEISEEFSSFCFNPGGSLAFWGVVGRGRTDSVVINRERASVVGREEVGIFKVTSLLWPSLPWGYPCSSIWGCVLRNGGGFSCFLFDPVVSDAV